MGDWTDTFFTGPWNMLQSASVMADAAPEDARRIRRALKLRRGSRVADIPCGDGRIAFELAAAGCDVVGVDRCVASIRRGKKRFREAGLPGTLHVGDMRKLNLEPGFDAVVNWWGSFGYFDDDTNLDVLRSFAALVRPGGRVLIDQINRERVLRQFRETFTSDYGAVTIRTWNRWDPVGQRIEGTWQFRHGAKRVRRHSSMRIYTPSQMRRLIGEAGLVLERFYDGADGTDYRRGSGHMTTIARRPPGRSRSSAR